MEADPNQEAAEQEEKAEGKGVVTTQAAIGKELKAEKSGTESHESADPKCPYFWVSAFRWVRRDTTFTDWIIALFTVVIAGVAYFQYTEMQDQLKTMQDTMKFQLSPYLMYEDGRVDVSKDGRSFTISIKVKNFGQTPAYSVTHWVTAEARRHFPDPFEHFDPRRKDPVHFTETDNFNSVADVGPGQSICIQKERFPVSSLSGDDVIYVWGHVKYASQFRGDCRYCGFVLQGIVSPGPIVNGDKLKLTNILPWTGPEKCSERRKAESPWPEEPSQPSAEPKSVVSQGDCPN
jgi:hypothetical protein